MLNIRNHVLVEGQRKRDSVRSQAEARGVTGLPQGIHVDLEPTEWRLVQHGRITHRTALDHQHRELYVLGDRTPLVFRIAEEVLVLEGDALYTITGVPGRALLALDGRVYLDDDGRSEILGLSNTVAAAIAGDPVPAERDRRGVTCKPPLSADALARWQTQAAARASERLENGRTWLHAAAAAGNATLVKMLLEAGADPHVRDAKALPLDDRWVPHFLEARCSTKGFQPAQLVDRIDALIEIGRTDDVARIDSLHDALLETRRAALERPWDPAGVSEAASYFEA